MDNIEHLTGSKYQKIQFNSFIYDLTPRYANYRIGCYEVTFL